MLESDDSCIPQDEIQQIIEKYSKIVDGRKLRTKVNHLKLLQFLEKWREGEQYFAFIIVSIQQNNLADVINFFHENDRFRDPEISKIFYDLMDLLVNLSK